MRSCFEEDGPAGWNMTGGTGGWWFIFRGGLEGGFRAGGSLLWLLVPGTQPTSFITVITH